MSYISPSLNFLITTVKKVGTSLTRDFNEIEQLQSSVKGHREFTQAAFERTAKGLRAELQKGKPTYAVVTDGQPQPNAPHFPVAPLDGMLNFIHGIPYFAISVAVVENGVVTSGVIYNPATSDLYFAEKGQGAFKEGFRSHERLRVSSRKDLPEAVIGLTSVADGIPAFENVRLHGALSLDLAYVASGRLDAVVSRNNSAASVAAGMLLVKEGGGYVYEINQKDIRSDDLASVLASGNLIAVNANLGKKLYESLNK